MIKILELFGGIGACSSALDRLGIEYQISDYVEIDKYAVSSYNAIHGTSFQPQDIRQWNKKLDVDLIMHGSPCQDFSLVGQQAGNSIVVDVIQAILNNLIADKSPDLRKKQKGYQYSIFDFL